VATPEQVRRLGGLTETVHAVVYFAPEPVAGYAQLGLRGYWRGYFASRAAALGTPSPELVTATFAGFAPAFVARAVPGVWAIASAETLLRVRRDGATAALRRALGEVDVRSAAGRPAGRAVAGLHRAARAPR
jgi:hypothetical protein